MAQTTLKVNPLFSFSIWCESEKEGSSRGQDACKGRTATIGDMMTSWRGDAFRMNGPLWRETSGYDVMGILDVPFIGVPVMGILDVPFLLAWTNCWTLAKRRYCRPDVRPTLHITGREWRSCDATVMSEYGVPGHGARSQSSISSSGPMQIRGPWQPRVRDRVITGPHVGLQLLHRPQLPHLL